MPTSPWDGTRGVYTCVRLHAIVCEGTRGRGGTEARAREETGASERNADWMEEGRPGKYRGRDGGDGSATVEWNGQRESRTNRLTNQPTDRRPSEQHAPRSSREQPISFVAFVGQYRKSDRNR